MTSHNSSQEYLKSLNEYSNPQWVEEVNYFCRNFLDIENSSIIDIGCGIGYVLKKLPKNNRLLVGLDVSRYLVSHAKAHCGNKKCHFLVADANSLPFAKSVFDHAFMIEVIEHLSDPGRALSECARILRRGGQLTLTTPNGSYYKVLHHRSLVSLYHVDEYAFWEIMRMIALSGFSLSRLRVSNRWPFRSVLRILGKISLLAPLIPGRFYIDAKRK